MQLRRFPWKPAFDAATSIVMLAAAVSILWFQFNPSKPAPRRTALGTPKEPLSLDGAALRGSEKAKAVLIMYSDFQCPFCRWFANNVLPQLNKDYIDNGNLLLGFRHFPSPLNSQAMSLAIAVQCAGEQGRFWQMHDSVFGTSDLDRDALASTARQLDLDLVEFTSCSSNAAVAAKIRQDADFGRRLGIVTTPSFFMGTRQADGTVAIKRVMSGVLDLNDFRDAIASLVGQALWQPELRWRGHEAMLDTGSTSDELTASTTTRPRSYSALLLGTEGS